MNILSLSVVVDGVEGVEEEEGDSSTKLPGTVQL